MGCEWNLLSGHLGEWRSVVPGRVSQRIHKRIRHATSTFSAFIIAVIIQDERGVQVITAGSVSLPVSIRVRMRGEELEGRIGEVFLLLSRENTEAIDPNFGLGSDGLVVGIERWREGILASAWQVWECEVHDRCGKG